MFEKCDCDDCKDVDEPCWSDCDIDYSCQGCYLKRLEIEELEFELKCQSGRN